MSQPSDTTIQPYYQVVPGITGKRDREWFDMAHAAFGCQIIVLCTKSTARKIKKGAAEKNNKLYCM